MLPPSRRLFSTLLRTTFAMSKQPNMKQTTLFSHTKGVPASAPQQPSLKDMWAKPKRDKHDAVSTKASESSSSSTGAVATKDGSDAMKEDGSKSQASSSKPKASPTKKRAASPTPVDENHADHSASVSVKSKKPRVATSSSTSPAELAASTSSPANSQNKSAFASPVKKASKGTKKQEDDEDEDEDDQPIRKPKMKMTASGKKNKGATKEIEEEEDDDDLGMQRSKIAKVEADSSASEDGSEGEGEDEITDEEIDDAVASTTKAPSKASLKLAEAALEKASRATASYPHWDVGTPVPYAALVACFAKIESTTKRLEIISYLTGFLVLVAERAGIPKTGEEVDIKGKGKGTKIDAGDEVLKVVYLCINRLCPDYEGLELGVGESILIGAIAKMAGRANTQIKADLKKHGDLGLVAMNSRANQPTMFKPKPLNVPYVFSKLTEIAKTSGKDSVTRKSGIIGSLLAACQGDEAKYIIRSLEGKLRIRLAEKTILVAIAHASVIARNAGKNISPEKLKNLQAEGAEILKAVYSELPNWNLIIPALVRYGPEGLKEHCKLTAGTPLKPMLAKPTKAITEVLDKFEGSKFTCEYKYDGERAQIHRLADGTITVFSRNSENMTVKYPDFVESLPHAMKDSATDFILDCEAVAWDPIERKLLPFQELSKRKRKDVKKEDITIQVQIFAFDILYCNGEVLLQKPLAERRAILREHFVPVEGEFQFATSTDAESVEEISTFLETSVKDGCEGLMVKSLETADSTYEPSKRSQNWLKLKKDYLSGVGDSLDLVVIGAYFGKGKRTNFYGAFLLACYDPDTESYQTACKIGTGFTEEVLASHYEILHPLELTGGPRKNVQIGGAKPDVWFEPKVVWEVLTADLSLSPIYTAAMGIADKRGISLRFPRFIRVRDDKDAEDATNGEQIAEMYNNQAVVLMNKKGAKGGDGDDFW